MVTTGGIGTGQVPRTQVKILMTTIWTWQIFLNPMMCIIIIQKWILIKLREILSPNQRIRNTVTWRCTCMRERSQTNHKTTSGQKKWSTSIRHGQRPNQRLRLRQKRRITWKNCTIIKLKIMDSKIRQKKLMNWKIRWAPCDCALQESNLTAVILLGPPWVKERSPAQGGGLDRKWKNWGLICGKFQPRFILAFFGMKHVSSDQSIVNDGSGFLTERAWCVLFPFQISAPTFVTVVRMYSLNTLGRLFLGGENKISWRDNFERFGSLFQLFQDTCIAQCTFGWLLFSSMKLAVWLPSSSSHIDAAPTITAGVWDSWSLCFAPLEVSMSRAPRSCRSRHCVSPDSRTTHPEMEPKCAGQSRGMQHPGSAGINLWIWPSYFCCLWREMIFPGYADCAQPGWTKKGHKFLLALFCWTCFSQNAILWVYIGCKLVWNGAGAVTLSLCLFLDNGLWISHCSWLSPPCFQTNGSRAGKNARFLGLVRLLVFSWFLSESERMMEKYETQFVNMHRYEHFNCGKKRSVQTTLSDGTRKWSILTQKVTWNCLWTPGQKLWKINPPDNLFAT